jgi:arginine decarboxylase-like protein
LVHTAPEVPFKVADAEEIYSVPAWSSGYFEVGAEGDMHVTLRGAPGPGCRSRRSSRA